MRIIIFANGSLPNPEIARALIRPDDFIIAADGGTRHALALGLTPNVVLGDFDSMTFDLRLLTEKGTQILKYPADKNETDLELALQHALTLNPDSILILAALGGRTDHTLANIALLTDPRFSALDLRFNDGVEEIFLCRDQARVRGRSGDIVSLIPWGGEVTGIVTSGLKWTLQNETLYPEKTRGISNEMTAHEAAVSIESGLLLIIHRSLTTDR
jgi:thiamine pyrophosphokinase